MLGLQIVGVLLTVAMAKRLPVDAEGTLECHRREFTFRASQTDETGRQCWDQVTAMSCWGRCDAGEIGDWRFPFKRPFHTVCLHERRGLRYTLLRNCDAGVDPRMAEYEYYVALSCACAPCDSSTTSCQGMDAEQHSRPGRILPADSPL